MTDMGAGWPAAGAPAAAAFSLAAAALFGPSTPDAPFDYIFVGFWAILVRKSNLGSS